MTPSKRGVLYMLWGDDHRAMADRSIASLKKFHPELPVHVWEGKPTPGTFRCLAQKAAMARLTPFEQTLFLDTDTVVLDRLDYGFDMADRHGLACTLCEVPFARRHTGLANRGDLVEYNTGVLFFTQRHRAMFDLWESLAPSIDSACLFVRHDGTLGRQDYDDQAAFAAAVHEQGVSPFVLPLNWNFRPQYWWWSGPIKIWHRYQPPPDGVPQLTDYYRRPDAVFQMHNLTPGPPPKPGG